MEKTKNQKKKKYYTGVINRTQVKKHAEGLNVSKEYLIELDKEVRKVIDNAARRTMMNGRKTILSRDI